MTTKSLVNAAMMTAIYLVLLMLYTIGILPSLMSLLLPIPIIVYSLKSRKFLEIILVFIACLIGSFFLTSVLGLFATFLYGISGIILGWGFVKKWPYWQRILNSGITYMIGFPILFSRLAGMTLTESSLIFIGDAFNMAKNVMPESNAQFAEMQNVMTTFIPQIMPTVILLTGIMISFFTDLIAQIILKRLRIENSNLGKIKDFQLGRLIAIIYLISQFGLLLIPTPEIQVILINIVLLLNILFIFQGIIVLFSFFKNRNKRVPITILIFLFLFNALITLSLLGVMDAMFDYRNRFKMNE